MSTLPRKPAPPPRTPAKSVAGAALDELSSACFTNDQMAQIANAIVAAIREYDRRGV